MLSVPSSRADRLLPLDAAQRREDGLYGIGADVLPLDLVEGRSLNHANFPLI